jgi:hypothetical protein
MSVYLDACKFTTLTGETSYGFKIYKDDYFQTYDNLLEGMIEDDLDLLEYTFRSNAIVEDILLTVGEDESITINGTEYKWEEIKNIILRLTNRIHSV